MDTITQPRMRAYVCISDDLEIQTPIPQICGRPWTFYPSRILATEYVETCSPKIMAEVVAAAEITVDVARFNHMELSAMPSYGGHSGVVSMAIVFQHRTDNGECDDYEGFCVASFIDDAMQETVRNVIPVVNRLLAEHGPAKSEGGAR